MSQISNYFNTGLIPSGTYIETITGNTGGAVSSDVSGNINIIGSGNITVSGNAGTNTQSITFTGILPIANGGTNASSMANTFGVNYFDGTRLVTTAVGTATNVLTSNGAGVAPTFQALPPSAVTSVTGTANQVTASPTTGAVILSTPATFIAPGSITSTTTTTAATGLIATAGGITATGNSSINTSGTGTNSIGTGTNSGTISIGNTSSGLVTIASGTAGINVGTTANAHASVFGSTNTTSSTTVQSGSGALNVTSTNGALTINSGTGTLAIGNNATAQTVNVATGAGTKVVTVGSTTTTSSLALRYGTADFTLASATGTVMSALDTGEITYPLQPAFSARHSVDQLNVTGAGTTATVNFTTMDFDQNGDYDGVNTFTAPVAGKYLFNAALRIFNVSSSATQAAFIIQTSFGGYSSPSISPFPICVAPSNSVSLAFSALVRMDAGDTCVIKVQVSGMAGDTVNLTSATTYSRFAGHLVC